MFEIEIKHIKDKRVRDLATTLIHKVEPLIKGPSSKTGRYHPPDEHGVDGLYIHCRRVCWWVVELCREANIKGLLRDCMIVAAMVHDIGRVLGKSRGHGLEGKKYLQNECGIVNRYILRYVATHMWHWDQTCPQPKTLPEQIFCFADYCASREQIITPFLPDR